MRSRLMLVLSMLAVLTASAGAQAAPAARPAAPQTRLFSRADWPQFLRTSAHTARNPFEHILSPLTVGGLTQAWASPASQREIVGSSPAVVGGALYIGSLDTRLLSLDARTGEFRWATRMGGSIVTSPAVVRGTVYVTTRRGKLVALTAGTGDVRWAVQTQAAIESSPTVAGGVVYFAGVDGNLYAVDARTGERLWTSFFAPDSTASPAVADGRVYVLGDDALFAFAAPTGALLWSRPLTDARGSALVAGRRVVVRTTVNAVAFDAATGRRLWTARLVGDADNSSPVLGDGVAFFTGLVAEDNGTESEVLEARSVRTGALRWSTVVGTVNSFTLFAGSPAVANGVVYLGSGDGNVYAFAASDGAKLWQAPTGGPVHSSPAVVRGRVYIGSLDAKVYAFALP